MDDTLRELKRQYVQDAGDSGVAQRYIRALEQALGGVEPAKKAPKRPGWECPDPEEDPSLEGNRHCYKHDQLNTYCRRQMNDRGGEFDGKPCDYTYVGPGGSAGSPDGICVYPNEIHGEGDDCYVNLLIDGKEVKHPVPAEAKEEYWESCIFCGHPEERK